MTKENNWKSGPWILNHCWKNYELFGALINVKIQGLLSGTSVWVVVDDQQHAKLDSLVIGIVESGKHMGDSLFELLRRQATYLEEDSNKSNKQPSQPKNSFNEYERSRISHTSTSGYFVVRLAAEEALFLVQALQCLQVHKGKSSADPWVQLALGFYEPLRPVNGDELLEEFSRLCPRFPYRYLAYFHYRSKGWLVRSGLQFGSDFVLYQNHPITVHSQFAVLTIPTSIKPSITAKIAAGCSFEHTTTHWRNMEQLKVEHFKGLDIIDPNLLWNEVCASKRVQSQVGKRLVLCYVTLIEKIDVSSGADNLSPCQLPSYKIRAKTTEGVVKDCPMVNDLLERALIEEIIVKRWNPGTKPI